MTYVIIIVSDTRELTPYVGYVDSMTRLSTIFILDVLG